MDLTVIRAKLLMPITVAISWGPTKLVANDWRIGIVNMMAVLKIIRSITARGNQLAIEKATAIQAVMSLEAKMRLRPPNL